MKGASNTVLNAANYIQNTGFGHTIILILVIVITFAIGRVMYKKMVGEKVTTDPSKLVNKLGINIKPSQPIHTNTDMKDGIKKIFSNGLIPTKRAAISNN